MYPATVWGLPQSDATAESRLSLDLAAVQNCYFPSPPPWGSNPVPHSRLTHDHDRHCSPEAPPALYSLSDGKPRPEPRDSHHSVRAGSSVCPNHPLPSMPQSCQASLLWSGRPPQPPQTSLCLLAPPCSATRTFEDAVDHIGPSCSFWSLSTGPL